MRERRRHRDTAARCSAHEADAHEVWLDDGFDRFGLLSDGDRERAEPDRPPAEPPYERIEDGAVESIEPDRVDVVQVECGIDCRRVAGAPRTTMKSRTRRSSRLAMRGVPRDRRAISAREAGGRSTESMAAERSITRSSS